MSTRDSVCGRPTNQGTPCTKGRLHWWAGLFAVEYADGCKWHVSPRSREAYEAAQQANEAAWLASMCADPICWGWSVPRDWTTLYEWQGGRCATCGRRDDLVVDHDHITGLVRGYLCKGCNVREGTYKAGWAQHHGYRESDTLFGKYRELHPTKMLGVNFWYR